MGVEAWINKDVNVYGHTLRNKDELKESIKECEETMKECRERLKVLVMMTDPQKMYPNQEDLVWYIGREFEELMDEYDRAQISLTRLWEFEEGWDASHDENGLSILPVDPLTMKNRKVYMGGDYVESVLENGEEVPEDYWDVYHGFVKPENCTFRHIYGYEPYVEEPQKTLQEILDEHKAHVHIENGFLGPEIHITRPKEEKPDPSA